MATEKRHKLLHVRRFNAESRHVNRTTRSMVPIGTYLVGKSCCGQQRTHLVHYN
jgi:hypothetical protein